MIFDGHAASYDRLHLISLPNELLPATPAANGLNRRSVTPGVTRVRVQTLGHFIFR